MAQILDTIKDLGFRFALALGVSISKNDIVTPPDKEEILEAYEVRVEKLEGEYKRGLITAERAPREDPRPLERRDRRGRRGDAAQPVALNPCS